MDRSANEGAKAPFLFAQNPPFDGCERLNLLFLGGFWLSHSFDHTSGAYSSRA
jgi:hypothetical protein